MKTNIIMTETGKVVAQILEDSKGRKFSFKTIDSKKHMLKLPPALAYDTFVIEQAEGYGVQYHVIQDRVTKRLWSAGHTDMQIHGFTFNRGFGEQIALELSRWTEGRVPRETLIIEIHAPKQLDLFVQEDRKAA